jgi:hypothetical protein
MTTKPSTPRNWLVLTLGLLLCLPFTACLNNNTDCVSSGSCITVEPTTADLNLRLTINTENPVVPIAIYLGDASDSVLYFRDTINTESISYAVALDQRYSGVAKYRQGQFTILAVDGDRTKLRSKNDCGDLCYTVDDATLKLQLAK